ncbi:hypothetical protein NC652_020674 [Populus alba x Populus x berolinensis]|nr:hypothetical protein NC652_020674 [Populus alba x Populus x berolinensis]
MSAMDRLQLTIPSKLREFKYRWEQKQEGTKIMINSTTACIFDIGAAVRTEDLLSRDGHAIDALNLDEYRISELQHQSRLSNWSGSMAHSAKTAPNLGASFSSSTIRASAPTLRPPHHTLIHSMILSPDY